jgi:hypothetical protein
MPGSPPMPSIPRVSSCGPGVTASFATLAKNPDRRLARSQRRTGSCCPRASIVVGRLALLGRRAQRFSPATNPDFSYGEGLTERSHAITVSHPPAAILRVVNPILRFLPHTPVMGAARKQLWW